jgi:hypothetical protein
MAAVMNGKHVDRAIGDEHGVYGTHAPHAYTASGEFEHLGCIHIDSIT